MGALFKHTKAIVFAYVGLVRDGNIFRKLFDIVMQKG